MCTIATNKISTQKIGYALREIVSHAGMPDIIESPFHRCIWEIGVEKVSKIKDRFFDKSSFIVNITEGFHVFANAEDAIDFAKIFPNKRYKVYESEIGKSYVSRSTFFVEWQDLEYQSLWTESVKLIREVK